MIFGENMEELRAAQELFKAQIFDLESVISVREEELLLLRAKNKELVKLKSMLDGRMQELENYRQRLEVVGSEVTGALGRELEMEREMLASLGTEKEYHRLLEKFSALETESKILKGELADAESLYSKIIALQNKVAELESKLEIVEMDRESYREELAEWKRRHPEAIQ